MRRTRAWWPVAATVATVAVVGTLPYAMHQLAVADAAVDPQPPPGLVDTGPSTGARFALGQLALASEASSAAPTPASPGSATRAQSQLLQAEDTPAGEVRARPRPETSKSTAPETPSTNVTDGSRPSNVGGPGTRASAGLPWRSGLVVGMPDSAEDWAAFRGRPVDVVHAYTDRSSWESVESAGWILGAFRDYPADLVISQPFWPEGSGGNLAACARGDYDAHWSTYGRALTEAGRTDTYTRLAWEFNGNWFEWSATDVDAWKSCYRNVVLAVRSTAPAARFEWNLNAHSSQSSAGSAWTSYPGDDVVDIVGIDPYDHWPPSRTTAEFDAQCRGPEGLCVTMEFARQHGKKVGVTEWGVMDGDAGGGDNPVYIEKMFETFSANRDVMAYETYFNDPAFGTALSAPRQNPRSADRYTALFGGRS